MASTQYLHTDLPWTHGEPYFNGRLRNVMFTIPEGSTEDNFGRRRFCFGRVDTHPAIREVYVSWRWGRNRWLIAAGWFRGKGYVRRAHWPAIL